MIASSTISSTASNNSDTVRSVISRWVLLLSVWSCVAVVSMLAIYVSRASIGVRPGLWPLIRLEMPIWFFWVAATIAIVLLARRFPLDRSRIVPSIALHLGAAAAAAILFICFHLLWSQAFNPFPMLTPASAWRWFWQYVRLSFVDGFVLYWAVLGVYHAFTNYARYQKREHDAARMQGELAEARLEALQLQLRPHFLFNSLNAVASLVEEEPHKARYVLGRLSELLRRALRWDGRPDVPLATEIEHLNAYLDIERIRFGERLQVEFDVAADAAKASVPGFILQPLVENAVCHGVAAREGPGHVTIAARRDANHLDVHIMDDGPGMDLPEHRVGIGLSNVKNRLQELYGADHDLALTQRQEGGLDVLVRLPYRMNLQETSP